MNNPNDDSTNKQESSSSINNSNMGNTPSCTKKARLDNNNAATIDIKENTNSNNPNTSNASNQVNNTAHSNIINNNTSQIKNPSIMDEERAKRLAAAEARLAALEKRGLNKAKPSNNKAASFLRLPDDPGKDPLNTSYWQ